jgi:hypothetical protein
MKNEVQAEYLMNQNETRKFYQEINRMWKDYKPQLKLCKGQDRQIINEN